MDTNNQSPDQNHPTQYNTHLFTVRVWQEAVSHTEAEWRGRLQHVPSGQVYYFRNWSALIRHLLSILPAESYTTSQLAPDEWTALLAEPDEGNDV